MFRAVITHDEGEASGSRFFKVGLRAGRLAVAVKRSAGTALGRLTIYRPDGSPVGSAKWGRKAALVADVSDSLPYFILGAEFTDSGFGQVEVVISNS